MNADIRKTLWATADKLRANMDAAEYKHLVLGLIFIKYISDTFTARTAELAARLRDPDDEYFYGEASDEDIAALNIPTAITQEGGYTVEVIGTLLERFLGAWGR